MAKRPVLIDLEDEMPSVSVADAPPVPETAEPLPDGQAMQRAAQLAARKPSRLLRWFFGLGMALVSAVASVAAWDFVTGLVARNSVLGWGVAGLFGAFLVVLLLICLRELAALGDK